MTDLSKLTAKDFSDAMHKGWEGLGWNPLFYFSHDKKCCCAYGAISLGLNVKPEDVVEELWTNRALCIGSTSDAARSKDAAMKAVDAILLGAKS